MLVIRQAIASDVPQIGQLVRELAHYERAPENAVARDEDLLRDGFGPQPRYFCLMAEWSSQTAGFAVYFHTYSTWLGRWGMHLEDLFVRSPFRGRGVGKGLLVELARIAVAKGCGRLNWNVLDWNTPALQFYEKLGARALREWEIMRLDGEALGRLAREGVDSAP